jgi:hypothetical protein
VGVRSPLPSLVRTASSMPCPPVWERGGVTYRDVHERGAGNQPLDVVFRRSIDDFDSSFLIARRMSACSRFDLLESSGSAGVAV